MPYDLGRLSSYVRFYLTVIRQIGGACEMEISPDKAAIVGGVSSSGLKPTDVAEQLGG